MAKVENLEFAQRVPPKLLLMYYGFVCAVTGYTIAATEPFKDLMRSAKLFDAGGTDVQELQLIRATGYGVSLGIIAGVPAGLLYDRVGPKVLAVLGQVLNIIGMYLMFFSPPEAFFRITAGCCSLSGCYACVTISHACIATLFPYNAALAISVLCLGNDLSLAVPNIMYTLSKYAGLNTVIISYMCLSLVIAFAEMWLVPYKHFPSPITVPKYKGGQLRTPTLAARLSIAGSVDVHTMTKQAPREDQSALKPHQTMTPSELKDIPVHQQMYTVYYFGIMVFGSFCFFCKIHYNQLVKLINEQAAIHSGYDVAAGQTVTNWFKFFLPAAVVMVFINGMFVDTFGLFPGMILMNTYNVCLLFVTSMPNLFFQWVAIVCYNCFSSFIFGFMYSYLGYTFGFATFGTLQSVLKLSCGATGVLVVPWTEYVVLKLPAIFWSNRILLTCALCMYALPFTLWKKGTMDRNNAKVKQRQLSNCHVL